MKCYNFIIPIYNWEVTLFNGPYLESDINNVVNVLSNAQVPEELISETLPFLYQSSFTGHTYGNRQWHKIITIFSTVTDLESVLATVGHEVRHMVNHVCSVHGLEEEGGAYVAGEFWKKLYESGFLGDIMIQLGIDIPSIPITPSSVEVNPTLAPGEGYVSCEQIEVPTD